ncbi:MAG: PASTA domain-containing protein [Bernardetiaceae bacterium]
MDSATIKAKIKQLGSLLSQFWQNQTKVSLWGNSWLALALNLLLMGLIFSVILFVFFYVHLPRVTNHGEQHYVPNLIGMPLEEVDGFLAARNFRYQIADTSYNTTYPPLSVIRQTPLSNAAVKVNRRIYLTINAEKPPLTQVPNFLGYSAKTAQNELQQAKLAIGKITMIPSPDKNAVQEIWYQGKRISEESLKRGFMVPEGAKIDIKVGSGEDRNSKFLVPKVVGRDWEEAEFVILGSGLNVGQVNFVYDLARPLHQVVRQEPSAENNAKISVGETIDIWVISHYKEEEE